MSQLLDRYRYARPDPGFSLEELDARMDDLQHLGQMLSEDNHKHQTVMNLLDGMESYYQNNDDGTKVVLALEGFGTPGVALEGFEDAIRRSWEAILRWIRSIIENIHHYGTSSVALLRALQNEIQNLRERNYRPSAKTPGATFTTTTRVDALCIRYQPVRDMNQVIGALKLWFQQVDGYYTWQQRTLEPGVDRIAGIIARADPKTIGDNLVTTTARSLAMFAPASQTNAFKMVTQGSDGSVTGPQLSGNLVLKLNGTQNASILKEFTRQTLRLEFSDQGRRSDLPTSLSIPHFSASVHDQVLDECEKIVRRLIDVHTLNYAQSHRDTLKKLGDATERFAQQAQLLPSGTPGQKETARQFLSLCQSMTDWLSNPYEGMTRYPLRTVRASLMLCRLNSH